MGKLIYLDNAATTKTAPEVVDAMLPYFTEHFGNPSSVYGFAAANKEVITKQREIIAKALGAKTEEIYFTAGGSESDNWALKATAEAYESKGKHIITTKIEHHAILHTGEYLQKRGYEVTYLDVDENGIVSPEAVEAAIRPDTILVSVMFANNEIGSIQPIKEIGEIAHKHGVLFHTDAVQAFGQVPINVDEMNIDMLSSSGHKLNGPKGIGFLYIRKGVKIRSFVHGGAQERKRRAGTENVPGIVGLGKAVELAMASMDQRMKQETELRDYAISRIEKEIPYCRLNGDRVKRLPNNINFSFQFVEGESLLIMLDMKGICASSGSACTSGSLDPSHVLLAIGLPHEIAHGSLRLTVYKAYRAYGRDIDCAMPKDERYVYLCDGNPYNLTSSNLYVYGDEVACNQCRRIWHDEYRIWIKLLDRDQIFFTDYDPALYSILCNTKLASWYIFSENGSEYLFCRIDGSAIGLHTVVWLYHSDKLRMDDLIQSIKDGSDELSKSELQIDHLRNNTRNSCVHNLTAMERTKNNSKRDLIVQINYPYFFIPVRVGGNFRVLCGKINGEDVTIRRVICHGVDELLDFLRQFRDTAKSSGEMLPRPEDRTKTACLSQMLMDDGREYHGDQFNIIEGLLQANDDEFTPWTGDVAAILM